MKPIRLCWTDLGAFRIYPPKFDLEYVDRLPDPKDVNGDYISVLYLPEIYLDYYDTTPPDIVTVERTDFRKIQFSYMKNNWIFYIEDWEQIK